LQYAGHDLLKLPAHQRVKHGLALVPEGRGVFARLTVAENLLMGAYHRNDKADIADRSAKVYTTCSRA
jgi:branched-chain amino acid transport system ATP-binding protein